jgi:hypothetical protein
VKSNDDDTERQTLLLFDRLYLSADQINHTLSCIFSYELVTIQDKVTNNLNIAKGLLKWDILDIGGFTDNDANIFFIKEAYGKTPRSSS